MQILFLLTTEADFKILAAEKVDFILQISLLLREENQPLNNYGEAVLWATIGELLREVHPLKIWKMKRWVFQQLQIRED